MVYTVCTNIDLDSKHSWLDFSTKIYGVMRRCGFVLSAPKRTGPMNVVDKRISINEPLMQTLFRSWLFRKFTAPCDEIERFYNFCNMCSRRTLGYVTGNYFFPVKNKSRLY